MKNQINCFKEGNILQFSFDESTNEKKLKKLIGVIRGKERDLIKDFKAQNIPQNLFRSERVFEDGDLINQLFGEHELMRYISNLEKKDLTLCDSMIPLGSCTMKLNSTFELEPLSSKKMDLHPFVPVE